MKNKNVVGKDIKASKNYKFSVTLFLITLRKGIFN